MSYEIKTAILDPKTGYNKIAGQYRKSWTHLDSFDKGIFLRYLPRDLSGLNILDLGAGDGRMYKFFEKENIGSFTACDIADKLLKKHPDGKNIKKVVCNLEKELPFKDNSFDLLLSFFVLEHIQELEGLFTKAERVMTPNARWIIGHFKQRKAYEHKINSEKFKIERNTYSKEDIKKLAEYNFFNFFAEEIMENEIYIGDVIVLEKKE